jgi:hypothetical protein
MGCSNCVFMLSPVGTENTIRALSQARCLLASTGFLSHSSANCDQESQGFLVPPYIHPLCPTTLPHSLACNIDLSKSARSPADVATICVSATSATMSARSKAGCSTVARQKRWRAVSRFRSPRCTLPRPRRPTFSMIPHLKTGAAGRMRDILCVRVHDPWKACRAGQTISSAES